MRDEPILVIDDDPSILQTVTDILEFEGYQVTTASNGAEGLTILQQTHPALILLDMRMPVLDGWGFINALQSQGIKYPVVVMTAAQDARRWAREVNADGYVAKPFTLSELIEVIEKLMGGNPPSPPDPVLGHP